jgi:hypothetical protein
MPNRGPSWQRTAAPTQPFPPDVWRALLRLPGQVVAAAAVLDPTTATLARPRGAGSRFAAIAQRLGATVWRVADAERPAVAGAARGSSVRQRPGDKPYGPAKPAGDKPSGPAKPPGDKPPGAAKSPGAAKPPGPAKPSRPAKPSGPGTPVSASKPAGTGRTGPPRGTVTWSRVGEARRGVAPALAGLEAIAAGRGCGNALVRDVVAGIYLEDADLAGAHAPDLAAACTAVGTALRTGARREDADAYRSWLEAIAAQVCRAAVADSVFSTGGPTLTPAQWRFLAELRAALSG